MLPAIALSFFTPTKIRIQFPYIYQANECRLQTRLQTGLRLGRRKTKKKQPTKDGRLFPRVRA
jgi:hypothetical protein